MTLDKPPLCVLFLRIRSKDMKVFLQSGFEGPLQGVVKKKKGNCVFSSHACLEPCTPLGLVCPLCTRTQTGPVGMTGPEADSKLVAKLGNRLLDWTVGPKPGPV